jgi:hypothetical protein
MVIVGVEDPSVFLIKIKIHMKKIIFIIYIILCLQQISVGQKTFSISGRVISAINHKPLFDYEDVSVAIANDPKSVAYIDSIGRFKIENLKEGKYKIVILDFIYEPFDTTVIVSQKDIKGLVLALKYDCIGFDKDSAYQDIKNGEPKLLLSGGIAPWFGEDDDVFEKKYGFKYYEFGCQHVVMECVEAYSSIVFDYLDKKFGKKWRKEVRSDVLYLKNRN